MAGRAVPTYTRQSVSFGWLAKTTADYLDARKGVKDGAYKIPQGVITLIEIFQYKNKGREKDFPPLLKVVLAALKIAKDGLGFSEVVGKTAALAQYKSMPDLALRAINIINPFKDAINAMNQVVLSPKGPTGKEILVEYISARYQKRVEFAGSIALIIGPGKEACEKLVAILADLRLVWAHWNGKDDKVANLGTRITNDGLHLAKSTAYVALGVLGAISAIVKNDLSSKQTVEEAAKEIFPKWVFTALSLTTAISATLAHYHSKLYVESRR